MPRELNSAEGAPYTVGELPLSGKRTSEVKEWKATNFSKQFYSVLDESYQDVCQGPQGIHTIATKTSKCGIMPLLFVLVGISMHEQSTKALGGQDVRIILGEI